MGWMAIAGASALGLIATAGAMPAQAGYTLGWFSINGSGARMSGGNYVLAATIGQPVTGPLGSGVYSMSAGFWAATGGAYTVAVGDPEKEAPPLSFRLHAPAPNPLFDRTLVTFDLPREGDVTLRLYNVGGRLVRTLASGALPAGQHQRLWDGTDEGGHPVAPGIYFVLLEAQAMRTQGKIVVVRN